MDKQHHFLRLGKAIVGLSFSNSRFADRVSRHIFTSEPFFGSPIGYIEYKEDHTDSRLIQLPSAPNAVYIQKQNLGLGSENIILRLYDKYTVVIKIEDTHVLVRHPPDIPLRLLLDDVLQAALRPIIERLGGFILHGACVVRDKAAIVFLGNSGSGKSSTAYNLTRFGFIQYANFK